MYHYYKRDGCIFQRRMKNDKELSLERASKMRNENNRDN